MFTIRNDGLSAVIRPMGAELCSLQDRQGREYIWQAGAAWPRHSPVLFPIVGQLNHDTYRLGERHFQMQRHGFARTMEFTPETVTEDGARFVLTDNEATHTVYPFEFRLGLAYRITEATLRVDYQVDNPGPLPLPFSIGAHPAFVWPQPKQAQRLIFDAPEPAPVRRLAQGLLSPSLFETPIEGSTLALDDDLFAEDALILDRAASRGVRFEGIHLRWSENFTALGLWSKSHADFLCIEPWAGIADPVGFDGDFTAKPGIMILPPARSATFHWAVTLNA